MWLLEGIYRPCVRRRSRERNHVADDMSLKQSINRSPVKQSHHHPRI